MVSDQNRLCPLEMCVPRDNCRAVFSGSIDQSPLESDNRAADLTGFMPEIEPQIESDLVIPASGSMQLSPGGPDSRR
jgi:hypothetical protein